MNLLMPHEILMIQRDEQELVNGNDGTDVIMHWLTRSGSPDEFGRYTTEIETTGAARAHICPPTSRDVTERQVSPIRVADQQTGALIFCFLPTVDLTGKPGLWFQVPTLGDFRPEAQLPTENWARDIIFTNQRFLQEIFCRPKN